MSLCAYSPGVRRLLAASSLRCFETKQMGAYYTVQLQKVVSNIILLTVYPVRTDCAKRGLVFLRVSFLFLWSRGRQTFIKILRASISSSVRDMYVLVWSEYNSMKYVFVCYFLGQGTMYEQFTNTHFSINIKRLCFLLFPVNRQFLWGENACLFTEELSENSKSMFPIRISPFRQRGVRKT